MSEGNPESRTLAMKLAAQSVALNPASKMAVPSQSTPIVDSGNGGIPSELVGSSMMPSQPIQPKIFQDDGLGEFDEGTTQHLTQNVYNGAPQPRQTPPQPSFQPQPTNHQAVFSPDLQGTILRKLSSMEKTLATMAERVIALQKQLDVWEKRIEFKEDE